MTPKIIIYYCDGSDLKYRILRSLDDTTALISDKFKWPLLVDLTFDPLIADKVKENILALPDLPYISESLARADLPKNCNIYESRYCQIENKKCFPLLSFMGETLVSIDHDAFDELTEHTEKENDKVELDDIAKKILNTQLSKFMFSVRTSNVLAKENIETINDLIHFTEAYMMRLPNFGRVSMIELKKFLNELGLAFSKNGEDPFVDEKKLLSYWEENQQLLSDEITSTTLQDKNIFDDFQEAIEKFEERDRSILLHRIGLGHEKKTLEELGEIYGVTRERIRQIESRALIKLSRPSSGWNLHGIWIDILAEIFENTHSPLTPDILVSKDQRLRYPELDPTSLTNLVTSDLFTQPSYFEVDVNGSKFLSRCHQSEFDETLSRIKTLLPQLEGKSEQFVKITIAGIIPPELKEFSSLLTQISLYDAAFAIENGENILKYYSSKKSAHTFATEIFEELKEPIQTTALIEIIQQQYPEIEAKSVINSLGDLKHIFPFSHGSWGTLTMLNMNEEELRNINKYLSDFVSISERDQFHSNDMNEYIKKIDQQLAEKIDNWIVSGLANYFGVANYLGRNVFSKTVGDASRIFINDIVINILRAKKRPMKEAEIRDEIVKVRHYDSVNLQVKPPVLRISRGFMGLDNWEIKPTDTGIFYKVSDDTDEQFLSFSDYSNAGPHERQWNEKEKEQLKYLRDKNYTVAQISDLMSITKYAVRKGLDRFYNTDETQSSPDDLLLHEEGNNQRFNWTDEKVETLKSLQEQGKSATQIADLIGVSRSSVLGKIHRLGLSQKKVEESDEPKDVEANNSENRSAPWSYSEIRKLKTLVEMEYDIDVIVRILNKDKFEITEKLKNI